MKRSAVETGFLGDSPPRLVRRVQAHEPLLWLYRGFGDLLKMPAVSLFLGASLYGIVQAGTYLLAQSPAMMLAYSAALMTAGFATVAGLNAGSRHLERTGSGSLAVVFSALWQRKTHLLLLALAVAALTVGWFQLASHVLIVDAATAGIAANALDFSTMSPSWTAVASLVFLSVVMGLLIVGAASMALPLVVDGDDDFLKAMLTSCEVFVRNSGATFVWMGVVAAIAAIGIFVSQLAMVFLVTVAGHAIWYGYRATVGDTRD